MGTFKKIILAIVILGGIFGLVSDFKQYGEMPGMLLSIVFMLTTVFLWNWASGHFPAIGKMKAALILLASGMATLCIINWALSAQFNVELVEVIRATFRQKPWFYALVMAVSLIKVFFWRWLFSGVREEREEAANAA
ncbi:hypothetical protein UXN85_20735 [Enterobacter hormaechei]